MKTWRRRRAGASGFAAVWYALVGLLVVAAVAAPRSVSPDQLKNVLFFGSLLGIAALGQHLVIAVGGFDLSVGPTLTLAGLLFASRSGDGPAQLALAAVLAIAASAVVGLVNGFAVTQLRIAPLIATLAVGGIVTGIAYGYTSGVPQEVSSLAHSLALHRTAGGVVTIGLVVWVVLTAVAAVSLRYTAVGRRLVAAGAGPRALHAMGFRVNGYRIGAYVLGAMVNGVAGILLASVAGLPGISLGGSYLITTIAAVVLGGTPLGGGLGSVLATAGGALFITQLNASAATLQASTAVQMILQGIVIAMAVALYGAARRQRLKRARTSATPPSEGGPEALADRRRPARLPIRTERV